MGGTGILHRSGRAVPNRRPGEPLMPSQHPVANALRPLCNSPRQRPTLLTCAGRIDVHATPCAAGSQRQPRRSARDTAGLLCRGGHTVPRLPLTMAHRWLRAPCKVLLRHECSVSCRHETKASDVLSHSMVPRRGQPVAGSTGGGCSTRRWQRHVGRTHGGAQGGAHSSQRVRAAAGRGGRRGPRRCVAGQAPRGSQSEHARLQR